MLDLKRIRNEAQEIKNSMAGRGESFDVSVIDEIIELDKKEEKCLLQ